MFKEAKPARAIEERHYKECFASAKSEATAYRNEFKTRLDSSDSVRAAFELTLDVLEDSLAIRHNKDEAFLIDMLLQHNAAKPMLEFLFDEKQMVKFTESDFAYKTIDKLLYVFVADGMNITNADMRHACEQAAILMLDALQQKTREDTIKDVVNAFFKFLFPKDGTIAYTPIEVVDCINRSVQYVLKEHFGETLGSERVMILDPFSGTGIFTTRMLSGNLLTAEEAKRKFLGVNGDGENPGVMANEIMVVGYYASILCINESLEDKLGAPQPSFTGGRLTDTFCQEKYDIENTKTKTTKKVKQ